LQVAFSDTVPELSSDSPKSLKSQTGRHRAGARFDIDLRCGCANAQYCVNVLASHRFGLCAISASAQDYAASNSEES